MKKHFEERPWGNFIEFTHNEPTTVKILTIRSGEEFSLQHHNKRKEFWRILSGKPMVTIGNDEVHGKTGDEFEIPPHIDHRIKAGDDDVIVLEISFGEFDESDIVRVEDKYGRV
jgi:mannose-6-phosphate isomerase